MSPDVERPINLDDFGMCEAEMDQCGKPATLLTDEGYRWCAEHAEAWHALVVAIGGGGGHLEGQS